MAQMNVSIRCLQHHKTGLWAAISDDVPGFILHGHSPVELEAKLGPALIEFWQALGNTVHHIHVESDGARVDGYDNTAFRAHIAETAADVRI